jgi:hypothetical protein
MRNVKKVRIVLNGNKAERKVMTANSAGGSIYMYLRDILYKSR